MYTAGFNVQKNLFNQSNRKQGVKTHSSFCNHIISAGKPLTSVTLVSIQQTLVWGMKDSLKASLLMIVYSNNQGRAHIGPHLA